MSLAVSSPHISPRPDWLALRQEDILLPELPIIDPHHHLWDRPGNRYLLDQLKADLDSGHRILATMFVQCRSMYTQQVETIFQPVGEVEFANGIAAQFASGLYGPALGCAGIVGYADLMLGDAVEPVLQKLIAAGGGRLKGIRNTTAWHAHPEVVSNPIPPPAGLLTEAKFIDGARRLSRHNLVLDVWAYHSQLAEVYELAQACPDTLLVIDHLGGPLGIGPYTHQREATFVEWSAAISKLAQLPNVRMKIGGFGLKVLGYRYHEQALPPDSDSLAQAWQPYVDVLIGAYGVERCMFESNFPVDKGMFSYHVMWNAFKKITQSCSPTERHALFFQTALDTYSLDPSLIHSG